MEAETLVRAVITAAKQYKAAPCDSNLVQLERNLEIMSGVSNKDYFKSFQPSSPLTAECLSSLIYILNDVPTNGSLVYKTMTLLDVLANIPAVQSLLHSKFYLTPCLASYLNSKCFAEEDANVLLCVKLMQKVTYNCQITPEDLYAESLIRMLYNEIMKPENTFTQPCLGLMANICRNNTSVQAHLKRIIQPQRKKFYNRLMDMVANKNQAIAIYSLTQLAVLTLHSDDMVDQVFSRSVGAIYQMMFNVVQYVESDTTRRYAVDLFADLLKQRKLQQYLIRYPHLTATMKNLKAMLCDKNEVRVTQIFELLLSFCGVNGLRCSLCRTILESQTLKETATYKQLLANPHLQEPLFAVIHWAGQSVETHDSAPLLAMDFLQELYKELSESDPGGRLSPRQDLVLPMLVETLMAPLTKNQSFIGKHCAKVTKALQLLSSMCSNERLQSSVCKSLDSGICLNLIKEQLTRNCLSPEPTRHMFSNDEWSEAGADVVLHTLDLMIQLRRSVSSMEASLQQVLLDSRIIPFLAFGLSSSKRDRVLLAMHPLSIAAAIPNFPFTSLGNTLTFYNAIRPGTLDNSPQEDNGEISFQPKKQKSMTYDKENVPLQLKVNQNNTITNAAPGSPQLDVTVQSLIDKMNSGLELKDAPSTEILSIYEHKIKSLETKEGHMQDLLEAKALALNQADRLIAQYRIRLAESETDSLALQQAFERQERSNKEYRDQVNEMTLEREKLRNDNEQMSQDIARLEAIANEFSSLNELYAEQSQVLENTQRSMQTLKQEHSSLLEMHEMLKRHNDSLKQQHDIATQQLQDLEEERKRLSKGLKEKEGQCSELNKSLKKTQDELKSMTKDRDAQDVAIDKLRGELSKLEQSKKEMQQKIKSLEVLCQQHEAAIKEKDSTIRGQKAQIEKTQQITAMIQQLSTSAAEGVKL